MRKIAVLLLALSLAAVAVWAQGTTSKLFGTIADPSGGVVPGATVTLTNEATQVTFTAVSSDTGVYGFESLQVGAYTVTVEMPGFKKFVAPGNRVTIGQPTTVNVTLEVGATTEVVEVSGAAELVQTSTSGNIGSLIEQRVLEDLPIVGTRGRNPLGLVLTQPGVVSGSNTGGGTHVNGARDRAWNFTLDGIDTNETSAGGSNFSPLRTNPDSLVEFRVLTSNFTAEYGRNSGAQVAMVTRSGTNNLHGSAFWFYRTPSFNANEWENNINGVGKRQFVQHIPGFSVGGPVIKNRTFFFVNLQWLTARESAAITNTVYTSDARKGLWRYVKGGRNTPAGATGASVDASGNVLPGINVGTYNIITSDPARLGADPAVAKLIALTPLPNNFRVGDGLNTAGYNFTALQSERQQDTVFKIDQVLNSRNTVFGRMAFGYQNTLCDRGNGGSPPFPGLPCLVNTERSPRNLALNWRWNPTSRITNEIVFGMNRFAFNFISPTADPAKPTLLLGTVTSPEDYQVGNQRRLNTWQLVENFSYFRGAHSFRMGFNFRFQSHQDLRGSVAGLNVSPVVNFSASTNTVGPEFQLPADINQTYDRGPLETAINTQLGRVGSISQGFVAKADADSYASPGTLFDFVSKYPELDFFWQDTWKVRRNLTVDLGLRWELKMSPTNPDDLVRRPNQPFVVGSKGSTTLKWESGSLYDNDLNNLGPSAGLAWDPFGTGKTSVRANYRLAYDRINTFLFSSAVFQSIPGTTYGVLNTDFGQAGGRLRNIPAIAPPSGTKPSDFVQPPAFSSNVMTVADPDFRMPKTNMWSLSIQRQIMRDTVLEVSYIGRRGVGLFGAYDVNQAEIRKNGFLEAFNVVKAGGESPLMNQLCAPDSRRRTGESGSAMVRRLYTSTLNLNSVAALAKDLGSRIQSGRNLPDLAGLGATFIIPFPQYSGALRVIDANDYSTFHSLQLKLERRFVRGLSYLASYSYSKSLDTRSYDPAFTTVSTGGSQSASSTPFDIFNRRLNYARSDFDRTHVLQLTWSYELPFGAGKWLGSGAGSALNRIIGGWQLAGFMTVQTGRPMTAYSGAYAYSNVVQTPANCSGCSKEMGEVFDDPVQGLVFYFNGDERAKFSSPAAGQFGDAGRNYFNGPGSFSMDLGIIKRTTIREGHSLDFRAEFTNLTNTPTFGFPTLTTTSTTFGRIRDTVISGSRKMQLGLKYSF